MAKRSNPGADAVSDGDDASVATIDYGKDRARDSGSEIIDISNEVMPSDDETSQVVTL